MFTAHYNTVCGAQVDSCIDESTDGAGSIKIAEHHHLSRRYLLSRLHSDNSNVTNHEPPLRGEAHFINGTI